WGLMELQKKIEKMHVLRKGGESYDFARAAVRDSIRPVHEGPALRVEQLKPAPVSGVKRVAEPPKPKAAPKPAAAAAATAEEPSATTAVVMEAAAPEVVPEAGASPAV